MTKAWFDNDNEVLGGTILCGCVLSFISGGIGLGLGWMFLGFIQGIGLGLVTAIAAPLVCCPALAMLFKRNLKKK